MYSIFVVNDKGVEERVASVDLTPGLSGELNAGKLLVSTYTRDPSALNVGRTSECHKVTALLDGDDGKALSKFAGWLRDRQKAGVVRLGGVEYYILPPAPGVAELFLHNPGVPGPGGSSQGPPQQQQEQSDGDLPPAKRGRMGKDGPSAPPPPLTAPKVAVIVPFRDLHSEQKRQQHLTKFVPELTAFLTASGKAFFIYIVEQSSDGRKFNRGKLLNIGFELACRDGCQVFVLHDVDLIPSVELLPWYTRVPEQPVHIARVWNRYSNNPKYFGGIVAFSEVQFRQINGFPNNFWGWGGEDDEMYRRVTEVGLVPSAPPPSSGGSIVDLEDMSLTDKLAVLKSNAKWKCMNKTEVLAEHFDSWRANGISSLEWERSGVRRVELGAHCARFTVNVCENSHWTDLVCGVDDAQYDKSVDDLRAEFASRK